MQCHSINHHHLFCADFMWLGRIFLLFLSWILKEISISFEVKVKMMRNNFLHNKIVTFSYFPSFLSQFLATENFQFFYTYFLFPSDIGALFFKPHTTSKQDFPYFLVSCTYSCMKKILVFFMLAFSTSFHPPHKKFYRQNKEDRKKNIFSLP